MKNTTSVSAKFSRVCAFFDRRNTYFGTFTFVKMPAFPTRAVMPPLLDSEKNPNTRMPAKRYVV